jgi:acetyl esterase/lipase
VAPSRAAACPQTTHVLEPAAQQIADATSKPPFLYQLQPDGARKVLDDIQAAPIAKPDVDETWITVPAEVGDVPVRIVKPPGATGPLPVVLYVHGGGWVLGNAGTHDRLVRELAVGTNTALVFVEYDRSPEAHHPRRHRTGLRHGPLDRWRGTHPGTPAFQGRLSGRVRSWRRRRSR